MLGVGLPLLITAVIYLCIAVGLIASDARRKPPPGSRSLDFDQVGQREAPHPPAKTFQARDGAALSYRLYPSTSDRVLILLHGSGWHSRYLAPLASYLSSENIASVVTPDLRGHGNQPVRRGDIDYIGQLVDDLEDLIAHVRDTRPETFVVVGGHSSGGGLALRFAESHPAPRVDGYVLLAPWLQHNAPTIRPDGHSWALPQVRRIIGLSMLNAVGIRVLNDLPVIRFNMPTQVRDGTETLSYSYRLMTGYAPANYRKALGAIDQALLVLVGSEDDLFLPDRFDPVINRYVEANVQVLDGISHLGIVDHPAVNDRLGRWLQQHTSH